MQHTPLRSLLFTDTTSSLPTQKKTHKKKCHSAGVEGRDVGRDEGRDEGRELERVSRVEATAATVTSEGGLEATAAAAAGVRERERERGVGAGVGVGVTGRRLTR